MENNGVWRIIVVALNKLSNAFAPSGIQNSPQHK